MKRLYQMVVDGEARHLGHAHGQRSLATPAAIRAVEQRLGVLLPKTFKQFAQQVGGAWWPVQIHAIEALARDGDQPTFLLPFASDGGGNDWCFDTRALLRHEYAIVFWDHEEPPPADELDAPGPPTPFDAWLREKVTEESAADDREALGRRIELLERALEPHREANTWPWAPSRQDVAAVEASIGFALPEEYVHFTLHFGSTPWPLHIVDALEIAGLTSEMRRDFPECATAVAIGRDTDGTYLVAEPKGRIARVGGPPLRARSFFALLERRIPAPAPEPPARPARDDVPFRIVEDEHTNAVWRAVARAARFSASPSPDGRLQIAIDDFRGGRRRMFITAEAWAIVEQHLAARNS